MRLPHKTLEKQLFKSGYQLVVGVDEVGMGCLAGPVVVCAVAMTNHFYNKHHRKLQGIRDSKLLLPRQREKFSKELLKEKDLAYAITLATVKTIDKINIYQASRKAMISSIKKLETGNLKLKTIVLIDGNKKIPGLRSEQRAIIKGDRKVFAIACASVIAKVFRDKLMDKYALKYPDYGFEKHKGYGTKLHLQKLNSLGVTPLHRRSYGPVAKLI